MSALKQVSIFSNSGGVILFSPTVANNARNYITRIDCIMRNVGAVNITDTVLSIDIPSSPAGTSFHFDFGNGLRLADENLTASGVGSISGTVTYYVGL